VMLPDHRGFQNLLVPATFHKSFHSAGVNRHPYSD
jgi:hypothetical protein